MVWIVPIRPLISSSPSFFFSFHRPLGTIPKAPTTFIFHVCVFFFFCFVFSARQQDSKYLSIFSLSFISLCDPQRQNPLVDKFFSSCCLIIDLVGIGWYVCILKLLALFSIATTLRCRGATPFLDCSTLPLIRTLYCWVLRRYQVPCLKSLVWRDLGSNIYI